MVEAEFATEAAAATVTPETMALHLGPYQQESFHGNVLTLVRNAPGPGPDRIEVRAVATEEEEWRRFLAREVDLVPFAGASALRQLRQVPSVRILHTEEATPVALQFSLAESGVPDGRIRRAISLAFRRKALAKAIIGDAGHAEDMPEDLEAARALLADAGFGADRPYRLEILILEGASEL